MTTSQLTQLLESITGHLEAETPEKQQELQKAQELIATSLKFSDDNGSEQLFSNSDVYSRDQIAPERLKTIATIAGKAVQQQQEDSFRIFVRTVPVRNNQIDGSVPEWAVGARVSETIGPFLNNEGREIWIDIYKIVKLVTLYYGTQPFLIFKAVITGRGIPVGLPISNAYTLAAGTIWINASMLSATAPLNRFVGLNIKGGTIKLNELPTSVSGKVTLHPNAPVTVSVQLVQQPDAGAAETSVYGRDARNAVYKMPEALEFSWNANTKKLTTIEVGEAACKLYGQELKFAALTQLNPVLAYETGLNLLLVPWQVSPPVFEVSSCESPFMRLSGKAPIINSSWALPTAIIDVNAPLEADGVGGIMLVSGQGLRAGWSSLMEEEMRLNKPTIFGMPGSLFILDLAANGLGCMQHLDLWKDEQHPYRSTADLQFMKLAPFMFTSNSAKSQELLTTFCNSEFKADRPIKANGEAFEIKSKASLLMLGASETRRLIYLYDDNMIADNTPIATFAAAPPPKRFAIALENALFTVSQPNNCMLFGECDETWNRVTRANFFLSFILFRYLPTLPDPYVGDLTKWERLFGRNDGATRGALAQSNPLNMLICSVRYSKIEEEKDNVKVGFHFGALSAENLADLPNAAPAAGPGLRAVTALRTIGRIKTTQKLTAATIDNITATNNAFTEKLFLRPAAGIFINSQSPVLATNISGDNLKAAIKVTDRAHNYDDFWNNGLVGSRLEAEPFALLDVSSNANQMGISVSGQQVIVQTGRVVAGADNQAAVVNSSFPFIVDGMSVKSPGMMVRSFTLPQISWEPVINKSAPDREKPTDPKLAMDPEKGPIYFPDDGGATRVWNNNPKPVSLAPIPVVNSLLTEFSSNPANFTVASFTLPFGLRAISYISKNFTESIKPDILNVKPKFRVGETGRVMLEGGIQMSLRAGNFGYKDPTDPKNNDSPMFAGYIYQSNNLLNLLGTPTGESNLGHRVTEIFNGEFLTAVLNNSTLISESHGVPVTRIDLTGYGANIFSDWLSPKAAMAQTSQAKFDVMNGRTSHEVIQVKSILYPWGIRVVRTITVFRTANGYVYRTDSGWKAESEGLFDFYYSYFDGPTKVEVKEPYEFHPGVIGGLFNVRNIKDVASIKEFETTNEIPNGAQYVNGIQGKLVTNITGATISELVKCGAVYFDADVQIENVVQGHIANKVVSKRILGYVQVAPAGKPLTIEQLRLLLAEQGNSIGGDLDCVIEVNKSNQRMRLNRFDVGASVNAANGTNFVVAARGSVLLPKDGSWAIVQHNAGTGDVTPLPEGVTVPLIRAGKWIKSKVINPADVTGSLLRIAHPLEILRAPGNSTINFGYLQTTATQKALFLTPAYSSGAKMLLSKTPPIFADPYRLMTGSGIFPNVGDAITNFGKAMPLLNGVDSLNNVVKAFSTKTLPDGQQVLELMEVVVQEKAGQILDQGMNMLKKGVGGVVDKLLKFDIPQSEIYLVNEKGLKIYIEYKAAKNKDAPKPGKIDFDVQSFAGDLADQWKSKINNISMVTDLGDMKRIMTIKGNFNSKKGKATGYEGGEESAGELGYPEIQFSEEMQPLVDLLTILGQLSAGDYGAAMKKGLQVAMSNSGEVWEYKFEASKDLPTIRFPPTDELYNSAQTPLKLEATLSLGVYFNAALKVTTDAKDLIPTAGAFLKFHGGLSVMCFSVGVGSIYAIGSVDVKVACDTKVGPNLTLAFGFGVSIVVSLPVVGHASVTFMIGVTMYADKDKLIITAMMLFRGNAELLAGLVCVTITIEAKGIVEKSSKGTEASAQVTFAIDISIFLIIDISFSKTWGEDRQIA